MTQGRLKTRSPLLGQRFAENGTTGKGRSSQQSWEALPLIPPVAENNKCKKVFSK